MSTQRVLVASVAALAIAGCTEASTPVVPEGTRASVAAPGHHVVGSGHVQSSAGLREFTFHAVERPGGAVSGGYKIVLPNGAFFEADVTCLAVEDETGWVAGTIRDTNVPNLVEVGSRSMFWARDDGEGAGAADAVSIAAFNAAEGTDLQFCADRPLELPPLAVTSGNVQVR